MDAKAKNTFTLKLDYRFIVFLLLLVIAGMLALWRPWTDETSANSRTISVTGEATLEEAPDEFVFYPSYTFKNTDKSAALSELSAKSIELIKDLKDLGVSDNKIKNESDGYNYSYYYNPDDQTVTYTLRLTITVASKDLAQKVQDYLVTTSPEGQVTPQAQFSEAKRKELESKGRDQATKNARAKADQSAQNLGFKVGKVKSIQDSGNGMDGAYPLIGAETTMEAGDSSSRSSIAVQPGQNELHYIVTVVYFVR